MKKRLIALLLCLLLLGLTACGEQAAPAPEEDTTLTDISDSPLESALPGALQDYLAQAGLIDPLLFDTATFAEEMTKRAFLFLADDTNVADTFNSFVFLAVVQDQVVQLYSLDNYALDGEVSVGDLDGNGDSEILTQLTMGAAGGAGNYNTRVFDLQKGQLVELFDFDKFDTGYSIELLKDKKYRITNRFTDYSAEFLRKAEDESYFDFWYDEHGVVQEHDLLVDSFFECQLTDTDQNGVCELSIRQYTSLVDHSDYMGDAVSVLTYDKDSKIFKVTQTSFEPQ